MILLSNRVIPIDRLTSPSEIDVGELVSKAKDNPLQFVFEFAALVMIVVGLYHSVGPVYQFFKSLGESLVYTAI